MPKTEVPSSKLTQKKIAFKFDDPSKLIKLKQAGQRGLGIDMDRVKEFGSTVTLERYPPGTQEGSSKGTPETKTLYDWMDYLVMADFDYDEENAWMLLKDGSRLQPTGSLDWATHSLFDAFTSVWKACRKTLTHASFYYLEHDETTDPPPNESWEFFVTCGNNIVIEHFSVMNPKWAKHATIWDFFYGSLIPEGSWQTLDRDEKAFTEWMYRKFFAETERGQILAIALGLAPGRPQVAFWSAIKRNPLWVGIGIGIIFALVRW
jgi:hypothetical protein